jgi:ketosteroid isomerase-like protein
MSPAVEAEIAIAEDRLRDAMLGADVATLDALLAPEMIFTNHLGQLLGKEDDLAGYRSGMLKLGTLKPSEQHVRVHGDVVIVSVRMQLWGTYDGKPANGDYRFTRIWGLSAHGNWQVIAAHSGMVDCS